MPRSSSWAPAFASLALASCLREQPALERVGAVRAALPAWRDRTAHDNPASGSLERRDGKGASVSIAWDADERTGALAEAEAQLAAGLAGGSISPARPIAGHDAVAVDAGDAKALVWRCDKTHRLLRLVANDRAAGKVDLPALGADVFCHQIGDKPVNAEVPVADTALLGAGWSFARRNPASASWLHEDAVLTLFAGQHTAAPRDEAVALAVAPGWARAAGLAEPHADRAERAAGPGRHAEVRVYGRALLDRKPVRFTLHLWRCLARGRSHAALVFAQDREGPASPAASSATPAARGAWTPYDEAPLAVRCHG